MDALPETALGPTDATAEHITAHIGLEKLLGGEVGANYSPKTGPFFSIAKSSVREPENAGVNAFKQVAEMKKGALSTMKQGIGSLFGKDSGVIAEKPQDKEFHDLFETTNRLAEAPELLVGHLANQTLPLSEHMPDTSVGLSQIAATTVGILHDNKPDLTQAAPLDMEKVPSKHEIFKFNNAARLLDNPMAIFPKLKDGSFSFNDKNIVEAAYPNLMNQIKEETMRSLIDYQAAKGAPLPAPLRMGLSRLFGQSMDSSMNNLLSNQLALTSIGNAKAQNEAAQQATPSKPKSGVDKMNAGTRDQTKAQQSVERVRK